MDREIDLAESSGLPSSLSLLRTMDAISSPLGLAERHGAGNNKHHSVSLCIIVVARAQYDSKVIPHLTRIHNQAFTIAACRLHWKRQRKLYRRWYFAFYLDFDDAVGFANTGLGKANRKTRKTRRSRAVMVKMKLERTCSVI